MSRHLTISGGQVVTPTGIRRADVVVAGERVVSLEEPGAPRGERIDVKGCYVLPGGVDPHTHLLADVATGTRSAAFGGTTTALCFTNPRTTESAAAAVMRAGRQVKRHSAIDVALHAVIGSPDRLRRNDLERLGRLGVRGVKIFLAYPELGLMATDGRLYEVLRGSTRLGFLTKVHCENGSVIQALIAQYLAEGKRQLTYFVRSRPPQVEEEAIARTLAIAGLARAAVYVTHMTTANGMELIRAARQRGQAAHAEVCLHHLLLSASRYERTRADRFLVVPPLRGPEQVEALWSAVKDGTVDTLGSDHAQSRFQPQPWTSNFTGLPYGLAGIELRLPLALSEGLRRGVALERIVEMTATRPAQLFGLFPRKGAIVPGADADLVVWDPRPRWKVTSAALHDGLDDSPYLGMTVHGAIRFVFLRGNLQVTNGEFVGSPSQGRVLE